VQPVVVSHEEIASQIQARHCCVKGKFWSDEEAAQGKPEKKFVLYLVNRIVLGTDLLGK
jgi:hypothetical protein